MTPFAACATGVASSLMLESARTYRNAVQVGQEPVGAEEIRGRRRARARGGAVEAATRVIDRFQNSVRFSPFGSLIAWPR